MGRKRSIEIIIWNNNPRPVRAGSFNLCRIFQLNHNYMKMNPTLEKILLHIALFLPYAALTVKGILEKGWRAVLMNVYVPWLFFSGILLILIWIFWDKFKKQEEEQNSQH
jgi:hypothetical protein